jgi:hypothetical protein
MKTTHEYVTLPTWTYEGASKDWYTLGAALVLADLENRWVKLNAATQRVVLGDNRFGRQSVGIFDGELKVTRRVCFGTDSDTRTVVLGNARAY